MRFFYFSERSDLRIPDPVKHAFDGARPHAVRQVLGPGPGGAPGRLVFCQGDQVRCIDKEKQRWEDIGDSAWCGWLKDDPPGPADLIRAKTMKGHYVKLCDGNDWLVPVARKITGDASSFSYVNTIPLVYGRKDGEWVVSGVVKEFQRLWEISQKSLESWSSESEDAIRLDLTTAEALQLAAEVMATNYYLSVDEVGFLGLLSEQTATDVLAALIDIPALPELSKKNAPLDTSNTAHGETEGSPDTGQLSQIST